MIFYDCIGGHLVIEASHLTTFTHGRPAQSFQLVLKSTSISLDAGLRAAQTSGVQEGQGRPQDLLITLSPNFPSSHSLPLTAVCAVAPSCCSQKRRLVTVARTSG